MNVAIKPVLLAVDDDPDVLSSIKRDLEKQYNDRFSIELQIRVSPSRISKQVKVERLTCSIISG